MAAPVEFVVARDGGKDLKFSGDVVASVSSAPRFSEPDLGRRWRTGELAGVTKRWYELTLYRTKAGNYVCHRAGMTVRPGEVNRNEALVVTLADDATAEDAVREFFGDGRLAKDLLSGAGMLEYEEVD